MSCSFSGALRKCPLVFSNRERQGRRDQLYFVDFVSTGQERTLLSVGQLQRAGVYLHTDESKPYSGMGWLKKTNYKLCT